MFVAFFECAGMLWCYGARRLAANAKDMTGRETHRAIVLCWTWLSPTIIFVRAEQSRSCATSSIKFKQFNIPGLALQVIWLYNLSDYSPPEYGAYRFPPWALALGFAVSATSLCAIPGGVIHTLASKWRASNSRCSLAVLRASLRSTIERCPCGCEAALDGDFVAHCDGGDGAGGAEDPLCSCEGRSGEKKEGQE